MILNESRSAPHRLEGLSVLVVEDETIISFLIEDMLTELGCEDIWHVAGLQAALTLLQERVPDLAVLDVNLGGELAYPIAQQLADAAVPFLFATGYGRDGIPKEWTDRPVVQKPFNLDSLARAVRAALPQSAGQH
jgi:DNA-binding response OmpR family regulator